MEIMEDLPGSNDHSIVIKGKRTKRRQKSSSPVGDRPVAVTSSSSSGGGGGGEDGEVLGYFYPLIPSSTTSTSDISTTSIDQEDDDKDIANCLILLAQGESGRKQVHHHHQQDVEIKMEKFSSRRFSEMATSTTVGKVGFFVYECKTCNRTFPSFQALGGHRASHKKPKVTTMEEKKPTIPTPSPATNDHHQHHEADAEEYDEVKEVKAQESTSKCLERNSNNHNSNNKAKNHECSICGAEFSSGQALGGHMRRHRNPPLATSTTTTKVSLIVDQTSPSRTHDDDLDEASHVVKKPRNNIFPLDLNLPAPAEDDHHHRDLKFQQHHLVFSAPALVDCHY